MAESRIPTGKKRYQITLTVDTVNQIRANMRTIGIPQNMFSKLIDDALSESILPTFQTFANRKLEGKQLTLEDIMSLASGELVKLGKELDHLREEKRKE